MKQKWLITLFASIPVIAAFLAVQSCGGVGGATTSNGGQGSNTAEFLALLSDEQRTAKSITPEACSAGTCHGGAKGDTNYVHWKGTTHAAKGVTCESCHGPGSVHAAKPTKTNILTFPKATSPVVCGQCHGPIKDQFDFSKHSKLIQAPVEEAGTDPVRYGQTSRCIACHSGLVRAAVLEQGKDLGTLDTTEITKLCEDTITTVPHTADCVTCHNPHSKTGKLNQNGEEVQLRHTVFNLDTTDISPGKTADKFTQYDHICAQCHNGRGTNPSDAALNKGTSRPSMHASPQMQMLMGFGGAEANGIITRNTAHAQAPGQCTKCHMPDARHTFTVSFDKSCSPCHTATDAAARADTVKSDILNQLIVLKNRMESYAKTKFGDSLLWEYTSNITAEGGTPPDETLVDIEVKRARHNYYFIVNSHDFGVHNAPYAKSLLDVSNKGLDSLGVPKPAAPRLTQEQALKMVDADRDRAMRAENQGR